VLVQSLPSITLICFYSLLSTAQTGLPHILPATGSIHALLRLLRQSRALKSFPRFQLAVGLVEPLLEQ
jgi:hypothetical protein